ncbi:phosphotransferase [Microtetraspora malaysiensis]|uniref:phosphotransferase n=1 Tax=Microtetraspora malaysiensis TaxID=161358 RepID=UPI003D932B55
MAGQPRPTAPGDGWEDVRTVSRISDHLVGMFRARVRETSWWPELRSRLSDLDGEPLVHLHGDIKPEHILVDDGVVHFVDREASARGPAIQDLADAIFHAVRDFEYDGIEGDLLAPTLMTLPVSDGHLSSVLAWRVALWADRRCPLPVHRLPEQGMAELLSTTAAADAVAALAQIIRAMRLIGTPR